MFLDKDISRPFHMKGRMLALSVSVLEEHFKIGGALEILGTQ
jgi:hypothetical protein